jgi:hypothetical protein
LSPHSEVGAGHTCCNAQHDYPPTWTFDFLHFT